MRFLRTADFKKMSKYVSLSCSFKKTVLQKKPGVILEGESVGTWESRVELLKRRPEGVGGGGGGVDSSEAKAKKTKKEIRMYRPQGRQHC